VRIGQRPYRLAGGLAWLLLVSACSSGEVGSPGVDAGLDGGTIVVPRDGSADAWVAPDAGEGMPDAGPADGGFATTIEVICRDAWGAAEPLGTFAEHTLERLTVHHTAVELVDNTGAPARVRAHQRYHQETQGWPDLAYHFVVDRNGHVYEGRPVDAVGDTGTTYDPTGHFLVVAEGNFETQTPTEPQLAAVASMLAWASREHDVPATTLGGHRDYAETACPGASLGAIVDDGTLAEMIRARLEAGPIRARSICGDEGSARVAEIESGTDSPYEWP